MKPHEVNVLLASLSLPREIHECHERLSTIVSKLEVSPHNFHIINDWNLVAFLMKSHATQAPNATALDEELYQLCKRLLTDLTLPQQLQAFDVTLLRGSPLELCSARGDPLDGRSPIPHSLLAAGSNIIRLNLSSTKLRVLPHHFGLYFDNLENLDLSHNDLSVLPDSVGRLSRLCSLSLSLSDNLFNHLPAVAAALGNCHRLQFLDLMANPFPVPVSDSDDDCNGTLCIGDSVQYLQRELPQLEEEVLVDSVVVGVPSDSEYCDDHTVVELIVVVCCGTKQQ